MTDTKPAEAMELKGCPFCGPGQSMVDPWFDDVSKRWAVGCGRCGASSGRSIHAEGSKEAAIKAWNTRALPAEAGAVCDNNQPATVTADALAFDLYYSDPENEGFEPDVQSADYREKYLRFANVFMSRFTITRKDGGR